MKVLVDSDILIEVSRRRNAKIISRWIELANSEADVLYSPVTMVELWAGAALNRLFPTLRCVPICEETGRRAGAYLARFRQSHGVELADALIASGAAVNGAELWTLNRKHYPMTDISFC